MNRVEIQTLFVLNASEDITYILLLVINKELYKELIIITFIIFAAT